MDKNNKRVKLACYTTNISMAVVGNLSPILFLTFKTLYDISYSLLGLLVLINFCTQLTIDLIFSFFSHKFNISKTVKCTPVLTIIGLLIYALWPFAFPDHVYLGLVIGTVIFSASGGLSEVLISPTIAAIPSENPEREMSKLHSIYAWGVVGVVVFATAFILLFSNKYWQWMTLFLVLVPLFAVIVNIVKEFIENRLRIKGKATDTAEYYLQDAMADPHNQHKPMAARVFGAIGRLFRLIGKLFFKIINKPCPWEKSHQDTEEQENNTDKEDKEEQNG